MLNCLNLFSGSNHVITKNYHSLAALSFKFAISLPSLNIGRISYPGLRTCLLGNQKHIQMSLRSRQTFTVDLEWYEYECMSVCNHTFRDLLKITYQVWKEFIQAIPCKSRCKHTLVMRTVYVIWQVLLICASDYHIVYRMLLTNFHNTRNLRHHDTYMLSL